MPYLECPRCRLTVYSAAAYSTKDSCPRCETPLSAARRSLFEETRPRSSALEPTPPRTRTEAAEEPGRR